MSTKDWRDDEEKCDEFAIKASELLAEYTKRIQDIRSDATELLDKMYSPEKGEYNTFYKERFIAMGKEFNKSSRVYSKLSRQCSQWLNHGTISKPHLRLEMEIRLADLEDLMRATEVFFSNSLNRR